MNVYELLVGVLRKGLFGIDLPKEMSGLINDKNSVAMFGAAKKHDIAHVFAYVMTKLGLLEKGSELQKLCEKEQVLAIFRYENQNYQQKEVQRVLGENGIEFVLLKGAVIRDYYPEPWLRSSCDIDILVKENEAERAAEILGKTLGYSGGKKTNHDYQLYSNTGVHVELHFTLFDENELIGAKETFDRVWDSLIPLCDCKNGYKLNDDMFMAYHISHLAKHIKIGGCGIKPILDLCYIDKNINYTSELDRLIEEGGLKKVYNVVRKMQDVWFCGGEYDESSKRLSDYVLSGGVYGNLENLVASGKVNKGGKFSYAIQRIFLPYNKMIIRYPKLKGKKWLMPFYQIKRWFDIIFVEKNVKKSLNELNLNNSISDEKIKNVELMNEDLGI